MFDRNRFEFVPRYACLVYCIFFVAGTPGFLAAQSNGVLREAYLNIAGGTIADLTNNPAFPASPGVESIEPIFEAPTGFSDNYGTRMRALLLPPVNGNYTFWISGDDNCALYLSTTENPSQRVAIATVNTWTGVREWTKEPNQQSAPIPLNAGQRYYIEALQKEGSGGDNLAVRWQLPNLAIEEPIPNNRLLVYGLEPPMISQQPQNVIATEGTVATFSVRLARYLGATFQWLRNGTNIPGAEASSYVLAPVGLADNGSRFRCFITNNQGATNSSEALLTVLADTNRPTVLSVVNLGDDNLIVATFSEPVETASAEQIFNYGLTLGASVVSASLSDDLRSVLLTTTPLTSAIYTLTINNVRDRATTPNTIATNTQRTVSLNYTPADMSRVTGTIEPLGPSSRRTGLVISEINYHPAERADGRNLEFIELYNAQEWFEDISGYSISGAIDYSFPSNTIFPARSFIILAAAPADITAVYGRAAAPYTNSLQNSSGTVRLKNRLGAVLLEAEYSGDAPYPAAADGAGHTLVLQRPSLGERNPRAWGPSDRAGGSPGANDVLISNPQRTIVINEVLAHTDDPAVDYIELFNYSATAVNVGGCILTDDPSTNKFFIPTNTIITPRGFLLYDQTQLGFSLSSGGETVYLKNTNATRVLDAFRFRGQANGVATGRYPDGSPSYSELSLKTPGARNARPLVRDLVINEIMYHPISGDDAFEFLELYNRGSNAVDLSDWRLTDGITFDFPNGTIVGADSYLIVANNRLPLLTNYPGLNPSQVLGNYGGRLANGGERVALTMPDEVISTNEFGSLVTNTIRIIVDEVSYGTGGRWGSFSDGGGSSLELIDPRTDNRLAPNWADSDDTAKSDWKLIEHTGILDHGQGVPDGLQIFLLGPGECLVDNIEVIPQGGNNLLLNSDFEGGLTGWTPQGNQSQSTVDAMGGIGDSRCLHIRASGRGDTGANRIRSAFIGSVAAGSMVTIRARVRWLRGHPEILLRLKGNWLEATGNILTAQNFGTPGALNSRARTNSPPAITEVTHSPVLPAVGQSVQVFARVGDPDGIALLLLRYRVDPATNFTALAMAYNGAGIFSAVIPAQAANSVVAFHIEAHDNFTPRATSRFPVDAPDRECLVRFADPAGTGNFGAYRVWLTQRTIDRWSSREKLSNEALDSTFAYGNSRVVYNIGAQYGGSPYHSPGYNSPVGNNCDYVLTFPKDDLLLYDEDINLLLPGNGCCEASMQREQTAYWMAYELGLPYCHRRHVNVFVNGLRRATMMEDAQQPNGDMAEQWFPEGGEGNLHKIQLWFEFDDAANGFNAVGASLGNFTTTGGIKKLARYRWNWAARAFGESANNYTNLFLLHDTAATSATGDAYTMQIESQIDVDQWLRTFAIEHIVGNPDSYGYGGGQNMYTFKPENDGWQMLIWDIDFAFLFDSATNSLFGFGDGYVGRMANHPPFQRAYLRAYQDAVNGPLRAARSDPLLDAKYNAFVAAGFGGLENPSGIKGYIAARRNYIIQQLANFAVPFTLEGASTFATNSNLVTLSGTAPMEVETLLVNGIAYRASWTTVSNWTLRVALGAGTNNLQIQGVDNHGNLLAGNTANVAINYTGVVENPADKLVINEIMYNPAVAQAGYVEIHNTSLSNSFDLSNWLISGIDAVIPDGTIIHPGAFLLFVADRAAFAAAYGSGISVAGEFSGQLSNAGETLKLIRPGLAPGAGIVVDALSYDDDPPWPTAADGLGPSLQLIDPNEDNSRVANWAVVFAGISNSPQSLVTVTNVWRYNQLNDFTGINWFETNYNDSAWPLGAGLLYVEGAALPAPKNTLLTLGRTTYYFRTRFHFTGNPFGISLKLFTVLDDGAVIYLNGREIHRIRMPGGPVTYSTLANGSVGDAIYEGPIILPGGALVQGENVLAVEVHQSSTGSTDIVLGLAMDTTYEVLSRYTPGAANSVRSTLAPFPSLWLNELQPQNLDGITDRFGERDPWLEIYNAGTNALSLNGFYLTTNYNAPLGWALPLFATLGPKEFRLIWLDGEPGEATTTEWHTPFRANPGSGSLGLVYVRPGQTSIIDFLNYSVPVPGRTYGAHPDGSAVDRRTFHFVTPLATNNPASPPINVLINEWMAANSSFLADPADGTPPDYEDWFELYNPEPEAADLSGFYLTDNITNETKWRIPDGVIIPGGGYLLVWADEESQQNGFNADLHANFRLSQGGEQLALFADDGMKIDGITFGTQTNNVSQGRFRDGGPSIYFMTNPTPRAANLLARSNAPPVLAQIPNRNVNEGELLSFAASASDGDPGQTLSFDLDAGAPAGSSIHPANGTFSWTPLESQGPGTYSITVRVTDDGTPALSDSRTFNITVAEVNNAPVLQPMTNRTVDEGTPLAISVTATDPDTDPQILTFSLDANSPAGMTINSTNGMVMWVPSETDGPGSYFATVRVTDDGDPPLSDARTVSIFVNELNVAPQLSPIPDALIHAGMELRFTAAAFDSDLPAQALGYGLAAGSPPGANLDPLTGVFHWRPAPDAPASTNSITLVVSDNGSLPLSAQRSFIVTVAGALKLLSAGPLPDGGMRLTWSAIPGKTYRLQSKSGLEEPFWTDLGAPIVASGTTASADDPAPASRRFYRIEITQ
jgi:hypothetical protein